MEVRLQWDARISVQGRPSPRHARTLHCDDLRLAVKIQGRSFPVMMNRNNLHQRLRIRDGQKLWIHPLGLVDGDSDLSRAAKDVGK